MTSIGSVAAAGLGSSQAGTGQSSDAAAIASAKAAVAQATAAVQTDEQDHSTDTLSADQKAEAVAQAKLASLEAQATSGVDFTA